MKSKSALLFDFFFVVFFAYMIWEANAWDTPAKMFPWAIGIPMLVLAILHLVNEWKGEQKRTSGGAPPVDIEFAKGIDPVVARSRALTSFAWIIVFLICIWFIGFSISTALMIFLYLKIQAGEPWGLSFALSSAGWLIYFLLFEYLLRLPFPEPILFSWFGIE